MADNDTHCRAKIIFLDALEQAPVQRASFIDRACAHDPALRAIVDDLLAAHDDASSSLDAPTVDMDPDSALARQKFAVARPGDVIGVYTLVRELGTGGFGVVFEAAQTTPVRRHVALKLIKAGMDTHEVVSRFEIERQALAILDHPGIAKVFDAGATEQGHPYFVMEFVRGEPITAYCDRERLTVDQRLQLFEQVCLALHHAHQKGVIHRDIKPNNVLITVVDGQPLPKIIDFGIAKCTAHDIDNPHAPHGGVTLTVEHQLLGTPEYMSPEQFTPARTPVDTRSDLYSLGVLLYRLLVGEGPYDPERLRKASLSQLEAIICHEEPPRPSTRLQNKVASARRTTHVQLRRALSGELDWIVMRAIDKDPARRYPTVFAFSADIRRYLNNLPVEACPPATLYRLSKFAARHRLALTFAGTVAILLVLVTVFSTTFGLRAVRAEQDARTQMKRYESTSAFLRSILGGIDPAVAQGEDTTLLRHILDAAAERAGAELADDPETEISIRDTLGYSYLLIAAFDDAEIQLKRALDLGKSHLSELHNDNLNAMGNLAEVYIEDGRYEEAEALSARLVQLTRRAFGEDDHQTLLAMGTLARVYLNTVQFDRAEPILDRILDVRLRTVGERNFDTLYVMHSLAEVYRRTDRFDDAKAMYERMLPINSVLMGPEHPDTITIINGLGALHLDLQEFDKAVPLLERVAEVRRRILETGHPRQLSAMNNLAVAYRQSGQPDKAESLILEALAISRAAHGDSDRTTLMLLNNLGALYSNQKRSIDAAPVLEECLAGARQIFGDEHPNVLSVMSNLAEAYTDIGQYVQAEELARTSVETGRRVLPSDHHKLASYLIRHGVCLTRMKRYDDAETALLEAYRINNATFGPDQLATQRVVKALEQLYETSGQTDKAVPPILHAGSEEPGETSDD